jgi:hypothetical protein
MVEHGGLYYISPLSDHLMRISRAEGGPDTAREVISCRPLYFVWKIPNKKERSVGMATRPMASLGATPTVKRPSQQYSNTMVDTQRLLLVDC